MKMQMQKKKIIKKLKQAYSEENLNFITSNIINCYKEKRFAYIREINRIICGDNVDLKEKISRTFSRIILRFHPDKLNFYINEINNCSQNGSIEKLEELSKIFLALDIDVSEAGANLVDQDFCFIPEYVWDYEQEGFYYFTEGDDRLSDIDQDDIIQRYVKTTFLTALKRREFGSLNIDYPVHELYDSEEIELADYEIDDLDGIELCKHLVSLDLSNNNISDISKLAFIKSLEEVYISNNQINFIDRIYTLKKLRIIDLSNNKIDDLSVLLYLNNLEYINIAGNNILKQQIEMLEEKGIIVIH